MNDTQTSSNVQLNANDRMMLRRSFFKLYRSINTMEFRPSTDTRGELSYRDIVYLNNIMFMDDCTVTKLVDLLNVTKPAVTVKVNSLVERGLIVKQKSPADSRVNILIATPATYAAYGDGERRINMALEDILRDYSPEDVEKFSEMAATLAHNISNTASDSNQK